MIQIDNLAQFSRDIDAWILEVEELADGVLRGLAVGAFNFILHGTPEWSGELAANWRITVGAPATGYTESIFKNHPLPGPLPEPFSKLRPNEAALNYARAASAEALSLIHVGVNVYISNSAPYALNVEENKDHEGKAYIRGVNLPIEMVHAAADKFGVAHTISEAEALTLAKAHL
jgi:hypothetical protein